MTKSYLKAFQTLKEQGKEAFVLNGDNILVEELPKEELKTQSGIIIASATSNRVDTISDNRPELVRVLLCGKGYFKTNEDGTEEGVPLDVKEGDVILVGKLSVKWLSGIGDVLLQEGATKIGLTRESEIQLKYNGQEGFDAVSKILKENI